MIIKKLENGNWVHTISNKDYYLSQGYAVIKNNEFTLYHPNGDDVFEAQQLSDITLVDEVNQFTYPTFTSSTELWNTLNQLEHFAFDNTLKSIKTLNTSVNSILEILTNNNIPNPQPEVGPIPFETQNVITSTQLGMPHVLGFKPYLAADFPMFTTDKKYIFLCSTDHAEGAYGAGGLYMGVGDRLDCSDYQIIGSIHSGYQSETPYMIAINGLAHLYYHTNASDPSHIGTQQTHLMTTTGGDINNLTWIQQGTVLGLEPGENHTGYLHIYEHNDGYKGIHITKGGIPQNYFYSTSTDGFTFTRDEVFNRTVGLNAGYQYKGVTGTIIQNLYGYNWAIMNVVPEDFQGNTTFGLIKLDQYFQPIEYCRDLHDGEGVPIILNKVNGDIEVYVEDGIANIYWKERIGNEDVIKLKRYDLADLQNYATDTPESYPSNTIAAYNFNNNVEDQVSNNNGTASNLTYSLVSGNDYAGTFNGSSYVIINDSTDFETNNIGIEFEVNTTNAGSGFRALVVKQFAFGIFVQDGELKLFSWDGNVITDTGINIQDGSWHKINVEFRNGEANQTKIFVDNQEVASTTYNFSNQSKKLVIGNGDDGTQTPPSGQHFNGQINNVRIYTI